MAKINIEGIDKITDFKTLDELKNEINETIDNRIEKMNLASKANDLSNKPFGYLKECFEYMAPSLYEYKEGKKILKSYINTIRENKNLKELHKIYENIRKASKDGDLDFFIENFVGYNWNIDKKTLKEDVKKLGDIVAEAFLYESFNNNELSLPEEKVNVNYAIDYVCENKLNGSNITNYSAAIKIIKEEIEKHDSSNIFNKTTKKDNNTVVKEFNEKYNDLDEAEKKVVSEIVNNANPETVFESYKNKCKEKIEEKKEEFVKQNDTNSVSRLESILEQINKKKYSEESLVEDITNIIDITNIFE